MIRDEKNTKFLKPKSLKTLIYTEILQRKVINNTLTKL